MHKKGFKHNRKTAQKGGVFKMRSSKFLLLALVALIFLSVVSCSENASEQSTPPTENDETVATSEAVEEQEPTIQDQFPFFENTIELSMWIPLQRTNLEHITTYNDITSLAYIFEKMNVDITFHCPAYGEEQTNFGLMVAAGNYPDIARHGENPGGYFINGAEKAIEDGIIVEMTDIIESHMPNYKMLRDSDDEMRKSTILDSGKSWAIFTFNFPTAELPWNGLVIRKDWLDNLNIDIPETLKEWEDALTAFRDNYNGGALWTPASGLHFNSEFLSAWNLGTAFFQENGRIKFGPIEDGFKEYVTMFNDWYGKGLIHRDFTSNTDTLRVDKALMANGEIAASNSQIATARNAMVLRGEVEDPDFWLEPVVAPVMNKGDIQHFGLKNTRARAAITIFADSPYIVECAKVLDYFYSQDGIMLVNYGIPDEHWYIRDGDLDTVFHELMYKTPEPGGMRDAFMNGKVIMTDSFLSDPESAFPKNTTGFTFVGVNLLDNVLMVGARGDRSYDISASLSGEVWSMAACDYNLPNSLSMTAEENSRFSSLYTDIETYVAECTAKMIVGIMPIDDFDKMVDEIYVMGIEECIDIQQAALDRYNAR